MTETTTSYNSVRRVKTVIKTKQFVEMTLCLICQVIIDAKNVRICANNSAGDNGKDKSL